VITRLQQTKKTFRRTISLSAVLLGFALLALTPSLPLLATTPTPDNILLIEIAAPINPVIASFIADTIATANRDNNRAVLIELDTPGGLDTAMRDIIQAQLNSRIPTIVYVAPQGARAASAGALITLAADFAAMAPGTNIGAATPVSIGGGGSGGADETMMKKVANDAAAYARSLAQKRGRNQEWAEEAVRDGVSISAQEALDLAVIDLIAEDREELLRQLDGYKFIRDGEVMIFTSAGSQLVTVEMNWRQKILNALSNPSFAYLLMMLGILGIFFEISQPGSIFPGAVGAIAILLALFAFSALPVNYVGLLLIVVAFILFILEANVPSYGMLAIGGLIAMSLGSLMLVDSSEPYLQISRAVIAATVLSCAAFTTFAATMVVKTQKRHSPFGQDGLIGKQGEAVEDIDSDNGRVFVYGEYWSARADAPIAKGKAVEVIAVLDGLKIKVAATTPTDQSADFEKKETL
jgi:membrane-bound serine protease (ClpP class)